MNISDRLKSLAALPLTRKFAIALVYALLVVLNTKLSLEITPEDLTKIAGVFAAVILGIAVEDAAEKKGLAAAAQVADVKKAPVEGIG